MPATTRKAVGGLALLGLLAACSGDVTVTPPDPSPAAAEPCTALIKALPQTVHGLEKRATDPASPYTAAWGDPAVTLRCGVPTPPQLTATSDTAEVDGVAWLPIELTHGYRFVTTGRVAYVEVDVPETYAPEVNILVDLAGPVASTVPTTDDVSTDDVSADPGASPTPS